jgi:hypothetical protein
MELSETETASTNQLADRLTSSAERRQTLHAEWRKRGNDRRQHNLEGEYFFCLYNRLSQLDEARLRHKAGGRSRSALDRCYDVEGWIARFLLTQRGLSNSS